jgi:DNA-binding Lrp family transcriptional regulator
MIEAFVLMQVDTISRKVEERIVAIRGVQLAQVVTGPYDVIVRAEAGSMETLGEVIDEIQKIPGVTRTLTCPVIRV